MQFYSFQLKLHQQVANQQRILKLFTKFQEGNPYNGMQMNK